MKKIILAITLGLFFGQASADADLNAWVCKKVEDMNVLAWASKTKGMSERKFKLYLKAEGLDLYGYDDFAGSVLSDRIHETYKANYKTADEAGSKALGTCKKIFNL